MHGGTNKGAPEGNRNAWVHGDRSAETEALLKLVRSTNRDLRLLAKIRQGARLQSFEYDRVLQWLLEQRELEAVSSVGASSG